ncbi:ABC transporter permease [Treponema phagedenis]|uniref:ABC transporter permease n=1 Tax=Treponema phagedenis TaxID=162 RepID=A0A0B7GY95_TREPH|nr:ABC transporter permease [Treponema phagedenis]NVP22986.1 ABC transporter permease [Treponema phagedenis]QEJ95108.1 ABC transporter permease [Treponema phagedenis]QEJ98218.1 ABC transporter permease [Treponema phagedenis]QEK01033.1 ABC transporter permease [Treponema phagedenis]QEK03728.1 ABC transporter permease [Treponema phagedenis]
MIKVPFLFALRFLGIGSGRSESNARKSLFGAVLGIGVSIIPLVIVLVVSDGMISGITSRMIELGSGHLQFVDLRPSTNYKNPQESYNQLQNNYATFKENCSNEYITGAWMQVNGNGIVIGKNGRKGGNIRAVSDNFFTENQAASQLLTVVAGSLEFTEKNSILLGKKIAEDLGITAGDSCRILTLFPSPTGKSIPKLFVGKVSGVISSGYQELDALWVFMPLETGMKILSPDAALASILVQTKDPFDQAAMQEIIQTGMSNLPRGYSPFSWQDMNRSQFHSFQTSKNILLFIMFLIVLVASANISSALVMLIMERRKEIAILKATGTKPETIIFSFLLAGLATGLGGLAIGMPIGITLSIHINEVFKYIEKTINALNMLLALSMGQSTATGEIHLLDPAYYLEYIPIVLNLNELYLIVSGTLILSVTVCMIPSIRAGKEKPIDIMRKL